MKRTASSAARSGREVLKRAATIVGARLPEGLVRGLEATTRYLLLGKHLEQLGIRFERRVKSREAVFEAVSRQLATRKVLYLEFGVYMGASMRFWCSALQNPEARLYGFDSFEGLPGTGGSWTKGQFDVMGGMPELDDERVTFIKGWFEETLPSFEVPDHEILVLNLDADLYSSTICALRRLRCHIRPGTFLYFDELDQVEHEICALREFINESGLRFRGVAAHTSLAHAFIECIG